MTRQRTVQQFERAFKDKAAQQDNSGDRGAGHKFWCDVCEDFKVKAMYMTGNGTPKMEARCRTCGKIEKFVKTAGFWFPESVIETLDNFAEATIDAKVKKMWDEAHVTKSDGEVTDELSSRKQDSSDDQEDTYTGSNAWQTLRGGLDLRTRKERLRGWMTCSRYLLITSPLIAGLGLLSAFGLLAYSGVYVHPVYEWIAPYYRPWMNSAWFTYCPLIGAAVTSPDGAEKK